MDNSVVYNKRGDVLSRGGGLSKQFPTDFYSTLKDNMKGVSVDLSRLKDEIVEVDEEKKTAKIELSEEDLKKVESVRYQLIYVIPRNDGSEEMDAMLLGGDTDVEENRETGTFTIHLNSQKWVTLDDQPLQVQVVSDSTRKGKNGKKINGSDICVSPISLNGENYKLYFSRNYSSGKITMIGAVPNNDGIAGLPSGELKALKKGDVVTPHYIRFNREDIENANPITKEDRLALATKLTVPGQSITIGDKPKIEMGALPNGIFLYCFEFVNPVAEDSTKNGSTLAGVICKIKNGKIVKAIHSDDFKRPGDLED